MKALTANGAKYGIGRLVELARAPVNVVMPVEESDGAMIADHLTGINKFESELWKIADDLRANSGLASNEYFMPIMRAYRR
jgi:hypothetical protein